MRLSLFNKILFTVLPILFLTSCFSENNNERSDDEKLDTRFVTIATGGSAGPFNIIGTTLGQIYSRKFGISSKTQTTGGSVQNLYLVHQGKTEMALTTSDVLVYAMKGQPPFTEKINDVEQIATLHANYLQIVASKNSGIKTMKDLRGKRVAVGDLNSGTETIARTLLNGLGITYDDMRIDYLSFAEAVDALRGGKIDAAILASGLPNASIMELEQGFDMQLVGILKKDIDRIAKDQIFLVATSIPAGTYNNDTDIQTVAVSTALIVNSNLSDSDVYKLTKTLFENVNQLKNAHQAAKEISLESARVGFMAPMHSGAKKYYDEQSNK